MQKVMKLYVCLFVKDDELLKKYNKIGKKPAIVLTKDLIANQSIMKNKMEMTKLK